MWNIILQQYLNYVRISATNQGRQQGHKLET